MDKNGMCKEGKYYNNKILPNSTFGKKNYRLGKNLIFDK